MALLINFQAPFTHAQNQNKTILEPVELFTTISEP